MKWQSTSRTQSRYWTTVWTLYAKCHFLDVRWQFRILANRNLRQRRRQDDLCIAPQTMQISKNAVRSEERAEHVPMHKRNHIPDSQVEHCPRISGHCCHLLKVSKLTRGPRTDCAGTFVKSWRIIETEDFSRFQGLYRVLG